MNKTYTDSQKTFILDNALKMTDRELTKEFNNLFGTNVTFSAMRKYRQRLGLEKKTGNL